MNIKYVNSEVNHVAGSIIKSHNSEYSYLIVHDRASNTYRLLNLLTHEILISGKKTTKELLEGYSITSEDHTIYPPKQIELRVGVING